MNLGPSCIVDTLVVSTSLNTPSHSVSTGGNTHQLSNNGSAVYFKYLMHLNITSITTASGSPTVVVTCVEDHGLNHAGASGAEVNLSKFTTSDALNGLDESDFEGAVVALDWAGPLTTQQFRFTTGTNATATGTITCTARGAIHVYKYLELSGSQVAWQIQYNTAPTGTHNN
jgi:hypothetical protein